MPCDGAADARAAGQGAVLLLPCHSWGGDRDLGPSLWQLSGDGGPVWPIPTPSSSRGFGCQHRARGELEKTFPARSAGDFSAWHGIRLRICAQGVAAASSLCGKRAWSPRGLLPCSLSCSVPNVPMHRAVTSTPATPCDHDQTAGALWAVPAPLELSHLGGGQSSPPPPSWAAVGSKARILNVLPTCFAGKHGDLGLPRV